MLSTGKAGTEWSKGRKCTHCNYYESEARQKSDRIGRCTRFGIGVMDCLCGCRKGDDGGVVLMNFGEGILDKVVTGNEETDNSEEEKEEIVMQRQNMTEEEMRSFSNEVLPLLKQIKKIAEENRVESGIRIWMSDGYVSLEGSGLCGWELNIHDGRPEMKFEKRVPLDTKPDEEVDGDGK